MITCNKFALIGIGNRIGTLVEALMAQIEDGKDANIGFVFMINYLIFDVRLVVTRHQLVSPIIFMFILIDQLINQM